jgi:hypothetical protein
VRLCVGLSLLPSCKERCHLLGLTPDQLFILAGVGVALVVLLFVLRALLRLTKVVLRLGCLGIVIIMVVIFVVMRGLGG